MQSVMADVRHSEEAIAVDTIGSKVARPQRRFRGGLYRRVEFTESMEKR